MANYYIMPKAQTVDWKGNNVFPDVDQFAYRAAHEGHGSEKALRVEAFETSDTSNPNVVHTYKSDTYLRFQELYTSGDLAAGDTFVLGMVGSLAELDFLSVEQLNTIPGLSLTITVLDQDMAQVEDESIVIDFANAKVDGRWTVQPVQKYNYDESADAAYSGRGEAFWLVATVTTLPGEDPNEDTWFTGCDDSEVPQFRAHLRYEDLCLPFGLEACAPQDVKDAYDTAIATFLGSNSVILWQDLAVDKSTGGFASCA